MPKSSLNGRGLRETSIVNHVIILRGKSPH